MDFGSTGQSDFLRAARNGDRSTVFYMLDNGMDINTSNANGLTALHLASKDGNANVVADLLHRGAKVNRATKKGNTALHIAALAGKEAVIRVLIDHGGNVNVQSQHWGLATYAILTSIAIQSSRADPLDGREHDSRNHIALTVTVIAVCFSITILNIAAMILFVCFYVQTCPLARRMAEQAVLLKDHPKKRAKNKKAPKQRRSPKDKPDKESESPSPSTPSPDKLEGGVVDLDKTQKNAMDQPKDGELHETVMAHPEDLVTAFDRRKSSGDLGSEKQNFRFLQLERAPQGWVDPATGKGRGSKDYIQHPNVPTELLVLDPAQPGMMVRQPPSGHPHGAIKAIVEASYMDVGGTTLPQQSGVAQVPTLYEMPSSGMQNGVGPPKYPAPSQGPGALPTNIRIPVPTPHGWHSGRYPPPRPQQHGKYIGTAPFATPLSPHQNDTATNLHAKRLAPLPQAKAQPQYESLKRPSEAYMWIPGKHVPSSVV